MLVSGHCQLRELLPALVVLRGKQQLVVAKHQVGLQNAPGLGSSQFLPWSFFVPPCGCTLWSVEHGSKPVSAWLECEGLPSLRDIMISTWGFETPHRLLEGRPHLEATREATRGHRRRKPPARKAWKTIHRFLEQEMGSGPMRAARLWYSWVDSPCVPRANSRLPTLSVTHVSNPGFLTPWLIHRVCSICGETNAKGILGGVPC